MTMINVMTVRPHGNPHGLKWWKMPGDFYSLPVKEAAALVADDFIFVEFPMSQIDNFNGVAGDVLIGSSIIIRSRPTILNRSPSCRRQSMSEPPGT